MFKISIHNTITDQKYEQFFDTIEELEEAKLFHIEKNRWGKKDRWERFSDTADEGYTEAREYEASPAVPEKEAHEVEQYDMVSGELETVVIPFQDAIPAAIKHEYFYPVEYTIEITDLSKDAEYLEQQAINNRIAEYPSIDEVIHIIMDHGIDSPEMDAIQAKRSSVKAKYPKK